MSKTDASNEGGASSRHDQRPGEYTNKGLIVDTYVRQNQDWIVPRRVMCAFFWTGIILLFTGIILLVTSKHKKGAYQSWGAVLLGLGFCLLLICLILCMHAYCVITVTDEEPPMILTVPPPPPSVLTLANGKSTADSNIDTMGSRTNSGLSYGSSGYHEKKTALCEEKMYSKSDSMKETWSSHGSDKCTDDYNEKAFIISNGEKRTLGQVGKLPSYSTALKMPPYAPEKRLSDNPDDVDIGYLKEDIKTPTLEKKRPGLRKSVTFDDSTGDVRVEFTAGDYEETPVKSTMPHHSPIASLSHTRPFLGSPPYDNEPEFQSLPSKVLSPIPEAPSSPSDVSSVAATTTTWSHIHPKLQVSLLKVATSQVGDGPSAYDGACQHHIVTSVDASSIGSPITAVPHPSELSHMPSSHASQCYQTLVSQPSVQDSVSEATPRSTEAETPVTLRKPLTVQLSEESSASSKLSVYDNVNYAWKSKSGSEVKHYHF